MIKPGSRKYKGHFVRVWIKDQRRKHKRKHEGKEKRFACISGAIFSASVEFLLREVKLDVNVTRQTAEMISQLNFPTN